MPKATSKRKQSDKPKKTGKSEVEKKDVFNAFVAWSVLPSNLKMLSPDKLEYYGFKGVVLDLMDIRTQGDFQKKFDVSPATISRWKKRDDYKEAVRDFRKNFVYGTYKDGIDHKFSQKVLRNPDPASVKLWHELYGDFVQKQELQVSGEVSHIHLHVVPEISKKTILELVIAKVAAKAGVNVLELMNRVENSHFAPLIDAEATVLESVPLPSSKPFDAVEVERKVLSRKQEVESKEEETRRLFEDKMSKLKGTIEETEEEEQNNDLMDFIIGK